MPTCTVCGKVVPKGSGCYVRKTCSEPCRVRRSTGHAAFQKYKCQYRWKGHTAATKAKISVTLKRHKRTREHCENLSKALRGNKPSEVTRKKQSLAYARQVEAGTAPGPVQHGWYESPIAGRVWLDSGWEKSVAEMFDRLGVMWTRNRRAFEYYDTNRAAVRKFYPDFYLPAFDAYVEVKGRLTRQDVDKFKSFPATLLLLWQNDMAKIRRGTFDFIRWVKEATVQLADLENPGISRYGGRLLQGE